MTVSYQSQFLHIQSFLFLCHCVYYLQFCVLMHAILKHDDFCVLLFCLISFVVWIFVKTGKKILIKTQLYKNKVVSQYTNSRFIGHWNTTLLSSRVSSFCRSNSGNGRSNFRSDSGFLIFFEQKLYFVHLEESFFTRLSLKICRRLLTKGFRCTCLVGVRNVQRKFVTPTSLFLFDLTEK